MGRKFKRKKKDFFDKLDLSTCESQTPICSHFNECGGCRFQNINYDSQLQLKKDYLQFLFKEDVKIIPAPNQFGYRNRMDFVYAFGKLGLRKKGDFSTVVDINYCHLMPKFANDAFILIKNLLLSYNIDSYDFIEHTGFLRYVTLRVVPSTQEIMAIFTTAPTRDKEESILFESFLSEISNVTTVDITSIYWFVNETITDIAIPPVKPNLIIGKETLIETIGDTSLLFGPKSFFQANSIVSEIMFDEIKKNTNGNIIDLCCGVGTISLFVREAANTILGIEEVPQAISLAKENAILNSVKKAEYLTLDMKNILDVAPMEVDTLIVDPPRSGLEKKVVKRILEMFPEKIVYMSCNPKTQKKDIDQLTENNTYVVTFLQGWDMFAQTNHVETLAVLHKL